MSYTIGILQPMIFPEDMARQFGRMDAMYHAFLLAGHDEVVTKTFNLAEGQWPQRLEACDGYLITGSAHAVYEDHDWLPRLFDLVRELVRLELPLLGLCFGHQAIAKALGGRVEKSQNGWGIGVQHYDVNVFLPWMQPRLARFSLLASHQDQVLEPPKDAIIWASSENCPIAGMAIGKHVLTIQPHPEHSLAFGSHLLHVRRDRLGEATWRAGRQSLIWPRHDGILAQWVDKFFTSGRSSS